MKKYTIMFWVSTLLIFFFEGVMSALTGNSEMAIQGITSLGYPVYFASMLTVFKVVGSLILVIPQVPRNVKEWAYAGFGIDFIAAFVSMWVVFGFMPMLLLPLVAFLVLTVSYVSYHKMKK
jgi:hypothetical protein